MKKMWVTPGRTLAGLEISKEQCSRQSGHLHEGDVAVRFDEGLIHCACVLHVIKHTGDAIGVRQKRVCLLQKEMGIFLAGLRCYQNIVFPKPFIVLAQMVLNNPISKTDACGKRLFRFEVFAIHI